MASKLDCRMCEVCPLGFRFEIKREIPLNDKEKLVAVIAENLAVRDDLVVQIEHNWEEIRKVRPLPNRELAYRLL